MKRVEKNPDSEKLAHVIKHGIQGLIVKNIESESTRQMIKTQVLQTFSQNLALQEAFETAAQINEELNKLCFFVRVPIFLPTFRSYFRWRQIPLKQLSSDASFQPFREKKKKSKSDVRDR